ncbi:hypothetical protein GOB93_09850 [Acetobacter musti]|uniref:EF-hand domain-containing protein n=1 Tax=Acetobacter musti TaxID=864732 RepID=A0ABX0JQ92_9PROT|nr:hypothetical protein [Acetobacter musti]NHN84943.1 hypothetical protein [Acetobacter musti]
MISAKIRTLCAVLALTAAASPAAAHRLNQYLQATTIALTQDGLTLHLRLTPGVNVADQVIRTIDRNGDGVLSPEEQQTYAATVAQGLSLSLNGKALSLQPEAGAFPSEAAMRAGNGTIDLQFVTQTTLSNGSYRLSYTNKVSGPQTVWLVNCLLPQDPAIHIVRQTRTENQSSYQLDFQIGDRKA